MGADFISMDGFDCGGHPGEEDVGGTLSCTFHPLAQATNHQSSNGKCIAIQSSSSKPCEPDPTDKLTTTYEG
eukprot:764713-Amphidinium_carterae.1